MTIQSSSRIPRMSSSLQGCKTTGPSSRLPTMTCSPGSIPDRSTAAAGMLTSTDSPSSRTFRVSCISVCESSDIGSSVCRSGISMIATRSPKVIAERREVLR